MKIASAAPTNTGVNVQLSSQVAYIGRNANIGRQANIGCNANIGRQANIGRPFNATMQQAAAHRRRMMPVLRRTK